MRKSGKSIGPARLYQLLNQLDIQPAGARQRPQQYPADAAERLLNHFGIFPAGENARIPVANGQRGRGLANPSHAGKLISVRQLRAAKPQKSK